MPGTLLIQLPLHPDSAWEPTGNVTLAPAKLAAAAGLPPESVFPGHLADSLGDREILAEIKRRRPAVLGLTLYLWNRERSLHLAAEYKRHDPEVLVVAGGPEVTPDNPSLPGDWTVDLFVAGEGEQHASQVLDPVRLRSTVSQGIRFIYPSPDESPPHRWPDPYLSGHLVPCPGSPVHIETSRGCGSACTYCAYRRTSPVPRTDPAELVLKRLNSLAARGAGEFVFLDPTFNSRQDIRLLLRGMEGLEVPSFAEVRGDLVKEEDGPLYSKAGFTSLETGLQTMSAGVLSALGRGGEPERIIRGAGILSSHGIQPVMDLILGLPGDHPDNVITAAAELRKRDIHQEVQTFLLSVLPGTEMREHARMLGIEFFKEPPYCVSRSGAFTLEDLLEAREAVSDVVGYDADPPPRPVLCRDFPGTTVFRPERGEAPDPPLSRHAVMRIECSDPWRYRSEIIRWVRRRLENDPFCPVDIILETSSKFPLDLLDMLGSLTGSDGYMGEKARIYSRAGQLRIAVTAPEETDPGWLSACSELSVTVVRSPGIRALPGGGTGLLLEGIHDLAALLPLYDMAPELVFFSECSMARLWNLEVLGTG